MTALVQTILSELFGLFVDDGSLAAFAVLLIAAVAGLIGLAHLDPLAGALLLLFGCLAILLSSVVRSRAEARPAWLRPADPAWSAVGGPSRER